MRTYSYCFIPLRFSKIPVIKINMQKSVTITVQSKKEIKKTNPLITEKRIGATVGNEGEVPYGKPPNIAERN